jgi:hypothetical protein
MNTVVIRSTAAVGGSLLGLLLLAGPTSAREIGRGDALPETSAASDPCRNVVPEDRAVCRGQSTPAPREAPGPSTIPRVEGGLLGLEPGTLGIVVLGGAALAGVALVTTRHRQTHVHSHRPA